MTGAAKWSILVELAKTGVAAVNFFLMATLLGPDNYGTYVLIAAISALLTQVCTGGYSQWCQPLAREVGPGPAVGAILPISCFVSIPMVLTMFFVSNWVGDTEWMAYALLIAVEAWIFPMWTATSLAFLATGRLWTYAFTSTLVPLCKLVVTVVVLGAFSGGLRSWGVVAAIVGLIGLLTTVLVVCRNFSLTSSHFRNWIKRGFGFASVGTASAISENVDRIVVGTLLGVTAAGTYGVGARLSAYGSVPGKGIALASYPNYFEGAEKEDYSGIRREILASSRSGFILGSVVALVLVVAVLCFSDLVFSAYEGVIPIAVVLFLSIPIRSVQYACGDALYALGRARARLAVTLVGALITLSGSIGGAHLGGVLGASVGVTISSVLVAVLLILVVHRTLKVLSEVGE